MFGETCPIAKFVINGITCKMLVDTGSRITLIKEKVFDLITRRGDRQVLEARESSKLRFVGITGADLGTGGLYLFRFGIGNQSFDHPSYICSDSVSLPDEISGLVGQDLLRQHGLDLILSQNCLSCRGDLVPLANQEAEYVALVGYEEQSVEKDAPTHAGVSVRTMRETVVPPRSEIICVGTMSAKINEGHIGVLEPIEGLPIGLSVAGCLVTVGSKKRVPVRVCNFSQEELRVPKNKNIATFTTAEADEQVAAVCTTGLGIEGEGRASKHQFDLSHIDSKEREGVQRLLQRYPDVFAASKLDLGKCGVIKHRISTGDSSPVYQRAYRIPYSQREEMDRQVQELIDKGIVEHSKSPWGAPALLVEKPDGSFRLVIDYRRLNSVTRIDPYPLPQVQETLSQLGSAKYFTVVDLASGFWQIEMDPKDVDKTAFNTPSGHFQWRRMPMGLVNSPAVWQRTADVILAGLLGKRCFVYMDDIIIYSSTFAEHLEAVEEVLVRLRAAGLKLKPSKCQLLQRQVRYLGHIVSADGVEPEPGKLSSVRDFPRPTGVRGVREFLGLIGYYRRHVRDFARIAKPLTALTKKNTEFLWSDEAQAAFEELKETLVTAPLLRYPDFSRPFIVATDASKFAAGAVLSQSFHGKEHPVAFASRQFSPVEQRYSATERECLAVVWAVRHFRCYLYGRRFRLVTDCQPLKWLLNVKDPSSRLARWNLQLQEYDFEIEHKPGKVHTNADALSRANLVRTVNEFCPAIDVEHLRTEQRNDKTLEKIFRAISEETTQDPDSSYFVDSQGTLRKRTRPTRSGRRAGQVWERVVVPKSMVSHVLRVFHDAPYAGHFGVTKTQKKLERYYYWHGMRSDVKKYCANCRSCLERKTPKNRRPAPLQEFEEVSAPFERIGMDILGPLPTTTTGNKYVLVCVDHLTKYAEITALPDQKAETVARAFVETVVLRHGVPRQLLTDQGSNFVSRLMKDVYDLLGIDKRQTTPYHPACNGAVERLNQTASKLLSHYISRDQRDWDLWIPFALFAYNTAVHESSGDSPFYLLHGRDPDTPNAVVDGQRRVPYGSLEDYRAELTSRLQVAHDVTAAALREAADKRKRQHNTRAREAPFRVGERVYLECVQTKTGLARKLTPKWKGPYRIVDQLSAVNFRIREIAGPATSVVHANRLKPAPAYSALSETAASREKEGEDDLRANPAIVNSPAMPQGGKIGRRKKFSPCDELEHFVQSQLGGALLEEEALQFGAQVLQRPLQQAIPADPIPAPSLLPAARYHLRNRVVGMDFCN